MILEVMPIIFFCLLLTYVGIRNILVYCIISQVADYLRMWLVLHDKPYYSETQVWVL